MCFSMPDRFRSGEITNKYDAVTEPAIVNDVEEIKKKLTEVSDAHNRLSDSYLNFTTQYIDFYQTSLQHVPVVIGKVVNIESKLTDRGKVGLSVAPSVSWANGGRVDGKDAESHIVLSITPVVEPDAGLLTGVEPHDRYLWAGGAVSPVEYMKQSTNATDVYRINTSAYLQADLGKGFKAEVTGSWNYHAEKTYRIPGGDFAFDLVKRDNDNYSLVLTKPSQTLPDGTVTPVEIYASDFRRSYSVTAIVPASKDLKSIEIGGASSFTSDGDIKAEKLDIEVSGASHFDANIDCQSLEVSVSGASSAEIGGKAVNANIEVSGAAKLSSNGEYLNTDYADVDLSGASTVEIICNKNITGEASGASKLSFKGAAKADVSTSGASKVSRK